MRGGHRTQRTPPLGRTSVTVYTAGESPLGRPMDALAQQHQIAARALAKFVVWARVKRPRHARPRSRCAYLPTQRRPATLVGLPWNHPPFARYRWGYPRRAGLDRSSARGDLTSVPLDWGRNRFPRHRGTLVRGSPRSHGSVVAAGGPHPMGSVREDRRNDVGGSYIDVRRRSAGVPWRFAKNGIQHLFRCRLPPKRLREGTNLAPVFRRTEPDSVRTGQEPGRTV